MYRGLEEIPVFAKAGAIIPMMTEEAAAESNSTDNPDRLLIRAFAGGEGSFTLWEDEGTRISDRETDWCRTRMELRYSRREDWEGEQAELTIFPAEENYSVIPKKRQWSVEIVGMTADTVTLETDGEAGDDAVAKVECEADVRGNLTRITLAELPVNTRITVKASTYGKKPDSLLKRAEALLMKAQIPYDQKQSVYMELRSGKDAAQMLSALYSMELNPAVYGALAELLGAY